MSSLDFGLHFLVKDGYKFWLFISEFQSYIFVRAAEEITFRFIASLRFWKLDDMEIW